MTYIILAIVAVIALVVIKIPYVVSRKSTMVATPEAVFDLVSDFNTWTSWSPWLLMETDCPVTVTGTGKAVGDKYQWNGKLVGAGEMEHTHLERPTQLRHDIRFLKPWKNEAKIVWNIVAQGNQTEVEWRMDDSMALWMAWMLPMMKAWIGYDYDRGLRMMKDLLETGEIHTKTEQMGVVETPEIPYLGIQKSSTFAEIGPSMEAAFGELYHLMKDHGIETTGTVFCLYDKWNMKTGETTYTVAFSVQAGTTIDDERVITTIKPATKALKLVHTGAYPHLANAWSTGMMAQRYGKHRKNKAVVPYEIYVSDPQETEPKDLVTEVYIPVQ